jgi:hypothetical protein
MGDRHAAGREECRRSLCDRIGMGCGFATLRDWPKTPVRCAIAAVYDGVSRASAARLGGMDRRTLCDWVYRFNADGPTGLTELQGTGCHAAADERPGGRTRRRRGGTGPGDGRGRSLALPRPEGTDPPPVWHRYHERTVGKLLARLGFAHISQRPRHHGQNAEDLAAFTAHQSCPHAGAHHAIKDAPKCLAFTEAAVPVYRERRVIRHGVLQAQPAKAAIGEVEVDLPAQPALRTDRIAVADDQHPDH